MQVPLFLRGVGGEGKEVEGSWEYGKGEIVLMHVYVRLASFITKPRFRGARLLILS